MNLKRGTGCTWKLIRTQDHQFQILLFEMTKKTKKKERRKKKKKRIINAHYRHPQPDHSTSSFFSLSLSLCSHSSITFSRLCNHTHTIIIICSRYARRALASCSLFKFFLPFSLLLLSSDHSKKGERERNREREQKKKKRNLCANYSNLL